VFTESKLGIFDALVLNGILLDIRIIRAAASVDDVAGLPVITEIPNITPSPQ
jgi:hypothetical protein